MKKVYHCVVTIHAGQVSRYHSCTTDEDRAYAHMGLLRRSGRTVGIVELDSKPPGVKAPPKPKGPVQGRLFDDDPESGQESLFGLDDAAPSGRKLLDIRARQVAQVMPRELPEHVKPFAEFMVRQSKKPINARDVIKAYAITVASVQRSHILDTTARYGTEEKPGGWPGHPGKVGFRVRPEDFMAYLLVSTKAGHEYLNAAERGQIDEQARDSMLKRFPWGLRPTLKKQLTYAATILSPKTPEIARAIRARRGPWVKYVLRNVKGVGPAKVGFFSALIGRGDNATADARQLNFWFCPPKKWNLDKGSCLVPPLRPKDATPAIIEALNKRMRALKISMPDRYKPFYEHLAHHAAWDAIGRAKTTHRPMITAMELAGPRKPKRR